MSASSEENQRNVLLKGGHVLDPANGIDRPANVRLSEGRVVAVGPDLPLAAGETVLDVAGHYVVPGIIGMHAHVFSTHRRSTLSLDPHANTFSSGVTTVVDSEFAPRGAMTNIGRVSATSVGRVVPPCRHTTVPLTFRLVYSGRANCPERATSG